MQSLLHVWQHEAVKARQLRAGFASVSKGQRLHRLESVVRAWSQMARAAGGLRKIQAVVRVRHRWSKLKSALGHWTEKLCGLAKAQRQKQLASSHRTRLYRRKGVRGWVRFYNGVLEKREYYGHFLQVYYKRLLARILNCLRLYLQHTVLNTQAAQAVRQRKDHHAKLHFLKMWVQLRQLVSRVLRGWHVT